MVHKYTVIKGIEPSYAERYISSYLNKNGIKYYQEVEFESCFNPLTKHKLRFDFYLPGHNILLEYDGKVFHKDAEVQLRDRIKNKFAKDSGIKLLRLKGELSSKLTKSIERFIAGKFKPVDYTKPQLVTKKPTGNLPKKVLDYIFTNSPKFNSLNAHDKLVVRNREKKSYAGYKRLYR